MALFTNQASLSYNGGVMMSNVVTGQLLDVLSSTKTAVDSTYTSGDNITYVISIVNTGSTAFNGLTVTASLGSYSFGSTTLTPLTYVPNSVLYFVNGIQQTTLNVTAGPPLVITGVNVPAGGNITIIYEASVNQYAPLSLNSTIVNTAVVSGPTLNEAITVSATVISGTDPTLSISKAVSPSTVTENSELTYTFVIQNAGNTEVTAAEALSLTDTLDPILNPISVTFNGAAWTEGVNYTYNSATGVFTTIAGQITVPAATFTQDQSIGVWTVTPGVTVLTITGTV